MPSIALQNWSARRAASLDEIEHAHRSVGGSGLGRRYMTHHLNQAYAVLLSSQFQGFCRELHEECVNYLVAPVVSSPLRVTYRNNMFFGLKLGTGNPNPGNIGSDFNRFGKYYRVVAQANLGPAYPGDQPPVPTDPLGSLVVDAPIKLKPSS